MDDIEKVDISRLVPDYVLLGVPICEPRTLEEGKTPWAHNIDYIWFLFVAGGNPQGPKWVARRGPKERLDNLEDRVK